MLYLWQNFVETIPTRIEDTINQNNSPNETSKQNPLDTVASIFIWNLKKIKIDPIFCNNLPWFFKGIYRRYQERLKASFLLKRERVHGQDSTWNNQKIIKSTFLKWVSTRYKSPSTAAIFWANQGLCCKTNIGVFSSILNCKLNFLTIASSDWFFKLTILTTITSWLLQFFYKINTWAKLSRFHLK